MSDVDVPWKDLADDTPGQLSTPGSGSGNGALGRTFGGRAVSADGTRLSALDDPERGMWVHLRLLCLQVSGAYIFICTYVHVSVVV